MDMLSSREPEAWMNELYHLSKTIDTAQSIDENKTLMSAVDVVEQTVNKMLSWVQMDANDELKEKIGALVSDALKSICGLKRMVRADSPIQSDLMVRVLNVADHLLHCHRLIVDHKIAAAE